ncbi:DUF494 family protein [Pleionea sp. CnH1-48]|uniref:DUF494 family protein n=1 Tax=Pleionea sp. CnH1-48 TaxID=2954494 RepID=UPI0020971C3C|nr:DUF494 domain-containing protein [Pleionea sp. CnH1-48]MCO7226566.1 DUF494 domain-containing protein [Pleionea sp. CnH1-48]
MKNDVLDVLLYIFERFQEEDYVVIDEAAKLVEELSEVGFGDNEIHGALDWLDGLMDARQQASIETDRPNIATRIFSEDEMVVLNTKAQGFLYHLEHIGVLDAITRELVIDRIMALAVEDVDLEQLKWITMMVLFNLPGQESAYAWFENMDDHIH